MPDHADAPVAGLPRQPIVGAAHPIDAAHLAQLQPIRRRRARAQRLLDRGVDRVILVVAGHLLDQHAIARVLEDDEIADEIQEAPPVEDPLDHNLKLAQMLVGQPRAVDGPPGHEPFAVGGEGADARVEAVGDDQRLVEGEQRRDLLLVGLELIEGRPDGGLFVGGVLQFHDRQRQAVDEQHHVRRGARGGSRPR